MLESLQLYLPNALMAIATICAALIALSCTKRQRERFPVLRCLDGKKLLLTLILIICIALNLILDSWKNSANHRREEHQQGTLEDIRQSQEQLSKTIGSYIVSIPTSTGLRRRESGAPAETNGAVALLQQEHQSPDTHHRSVQDTTQLVFKELQSFLGPDGFSVKSPYQFFEKNNEIGQVDIGIYGKVGAFGESLWAIEFKTPQVTNDVAWIRELRGIREQFNIQRMMAASTTDFTPEAIRAADQLDVELVRIDDRELVAITNWVKSIDWIHHTAFWVTNGIIDARTDPIFQSNQDIMADNIFREKGSTNLLSLAEYIAPNVKQLLDSLPTNTVQDVILAYVTPASDGRTEGSFTTERPLTTNDTVVLIPFTHPVDVAVDWRMSRLVSMSVPIRLRSEAIQSKVLLSVYRNLKDGSILGMGGVVSHMIPDANKYGMHAKTMILLRNDNKGGYTMQLKFFNEKDEPINITTNSYISLWGLQ